MKRHLIMFVAAGALVILYRLLTWSHEDARTMGPLQICNSNLLSLEGAAELYAMQERIPGQGRLDPAALLRGGWLKTPVACPDGGTYEVRYAKDPGAASGTVEVGCGVHGGPPFQPAPRRPSR